ncbi:TetR/AcrR family transcriptional regulator [[Mycobacterium] burgundiense]|uniref:TetR/AcrR family transcriptional regulator n=1 Tax=[Mycobacterium] burgundiense TaxID=3064286 RepID=A0ABN9NQG9_9MYCO|nr:TetR/AcrR family transcriptional regulator [Mycolicibacterium sp. MU0053]CAJ1510388.1 TetR/AcrR family transcriptional regulator [Mycolicibacterium sp. MU0053]
MVRPAQTLRSERTRAALRQAAQVRFLAQGVEATSAEQIAADAGVSLRTFYRHFTSKHDLLFADYDAGLQWFATALAARPDDEPVITAVQNAIFAFPFDNEAVTKIAVLRAAELDPERIVSHLRQVEADFAAAVQKRLARTHGATLTRPDGALHVAVAARCIAAAIFGAMEVWMLDGSAGERSLPELARMCREAVTSLETGILAPLVLS